MIDIATKLKDLFESVEAKFREARVELYVSRANSELETWRKKLSGEIARPEKESSSFGRSYRDHFEYKGEYVQFPSWEDCKAIESRVWDGKVKQSDLYYADVERAKADANREVDSAKANFVSKMSGKLDSAFGKRNDLAAIDGKLAYDSGAITGHLRCDFANGDSFVVTMSIIINYRYNGYRGANGFYQFPARFKSVRVGNVKKNAASEKWMKENFNAGAGK